MKFEHTEVWGFEHALRGMRNPKNSWDRNDSVNCTNCTAENVDSCPYVKPFYCCFGRKNFIIGKNDMKLAQKLIRAGSEHRKFMRQIFVSVDITAPLYWWKEFDTYKVGTVENSTSTMYKLATTPITIDCFETDDYKPDIMIEQTLVYHERVDDMVSCLIQPLEKLRQKYLETKDKKCWKELIRWLPESWLQTRTVTMNYENLLAMCSKGQRRFHKLNEWSGADNAQVPNFIAWARTLPYAQEFVFIDEVVEQ
mgnify:CR=1 FL=1